VTILKRSQSDSSGLSPRPKCAFITKFFHTRLKGTRTVQADSGSDSDSKSRRKESPLLNSAGAYSGGRLQWVDADSRSQMVYQNDFLTPINRLTPTVTL